MKKLYVGNLSFGTTEDSLNAAFAAFGTVLSTAIIQDRETGRSRGFLRKFQVSTQNSIAIGDSSADIEMFDEAAFSIAIEPSSDQVAAKADFVCQTTNFKELLSFFKTF